jgi:hypothetical protein
MTVDGTDFWVYEPTPFDTQWYSHKINGPALRYEVAVCIKKTGWIVWINPFQLELGQISTLPSFP